MEVRLIAYTTNPLNTMAFAASRCYMSEPKPSIVKNCWESGHGSICEHCNFTFEITGVSRSLLAQLTRHRLASYSVTSQRYVDMKDYNMICPKSIQNDFAAKEKFDSIVASIKEGYEELQAMGIKNEDARSILPNACETNIVMTINLRSLANFMNERLCSRAQQEIQTLARKMKKEVLNLECWGDFSTYLENRILVPKCEKGKITYCPEHKSCGRHKPARGLRVSLLQDEELED